MNLSINFQINEEAKRLVARSDYLLELSRVTNARCAAASSVLRGVLARGESDCQAGDYLYVRREKVRTDGLAVPGYGDLRDIRSGAAPYDDGAAPNHSHTRHYESAASRAEGRGLIPKLRYFGIYSIPGSTHLVYPVPVLGTFYLYDSVHGAGLSPRFKVKNDGSVEGWFGEPVSWRVEDMVDTGETYGR